MINIIKSSCKLMKKSFRRKIRRIPKLKIKKYLKKKMIKRYKMKLKNVKSTKNNVIKIFKMLKS